MTVAVSDGGEDSAAAATEDFTVSVTAVNDPPSITSTAPTAATEETEYSYQVLVSDPDDSGSELKLRVDQCTGGYDDQRIGSDHLDTE